MLGHHKLCSLLVLSSHAAADSHLTSQTAMLCMLGEVMLCMLGMVMLCTLGMVMLCMLCMAFRPHLEKQAMSWHIRAGFLKAARAHSHNAAGPGAHNKVGGREVVFLGGVRPLKPGLGHLREVHRLDGPRLQILHTVLMHACTASECNQWSGAEAAQWL